MSVTRSQKNGLQLLSIKTPIVEAIISQHGAQLLSWKPHNEEEVFYLSPSTVYDKSKAIRGGIPICWPWFGGVKSPSHGFARISEWNEDNIKINDDGSINAIFSLDLKLPKDNVDLKAVTEYIINSTSMTMKMSTTSLDSSKSDYDLTTALHAYFAIGDISKIEINGLQNFNYTEKGKNLKEHPDKPFLRLDGEVDREYAPVDEKAVVEIKDEVKKRTIKIEREGSRSVVVWNIGEIGVKGLSDMPDEDYTKYVCVETANANVDVIHLAPSQSHTLKFTASIVK